MKMPAAVFLGSAGFSSPAFVMIILSVSWWEEYGTLRGTSGNGLRCTIGTQNSQYTVFSGKVSAFPEHISCLDLLAVQ
jgi:hypothetical protein